MAGELGVGEAVAVTDCAALLVGVGIALAGARWSWSAARLAAGAWQAAPAPATSTTVVTVVITRTTGDGANPPRWRVPSKPLAHDSLPILHYETQLTQSRFRQID